MLKLLTCHDLNKLVPKENNKIYHIYKSFQKESES